MKCNCSKCRRNKNLKKGAAGAIVGIVSLVVIALIFYPTVFGQLGIIKAEKTPANVQALSGQEVPVPMLIHQLINEERTKAGLNTLQWDDRIANLAQQHSAEMATNDYFEHESLDGKTPHQRGIANGVCILAENIIQGGSYYGDFSNNDIAIKAVRGWMGSEGHRHNILGPHSQEGIGVAYDNSGTKLYITQDFC